MTDNNNKALKRTYRWIGWAAFACFVLGIASGAWILNRYIDHKSAQDIADILVGSAGLVFTLGSALLFGYTIFQTKHEISIQIQEMQKSNNTFNKQYRLSKRQQNINILFTLIQNHNSFVNTISYGGQIGFAGINELYVNVKSSQSRYYNIMGFKTINHFDDTLHFPKYMFENQADFISSIAQNVCYTIRLVDTSLRADNKYYELLNNHLSVAERYLIGYYCNFYNDQSTEYLKSHSYPFLAFYNRDYHVDVSSKNYFPSVRFNWFEMNGNFSLGENPKGERFSGYFGFSVQVMDNEFEMPLVISEVSLTVFENFQERFSKHKTVNYEIPDSIARVLFSINDLANDMLKEFKPINQDLEFEATVTFKYDGVRFTHTKSKQFTPHPGGRYVLFTAK